MKELTRREFFDLVWSKPMTELAKEFGVSDVTLHKTCKRHRIPTPGRGYWAKFMAGQSVKPATFRDISDKILNIVRIHPSNIQSLPPEVKEARTQARAKAKEQKEKLATISPSGQLHPYVEKLKRKLETAQIQKSECAHIHEPKFFSISISPKSTTRLIAILDSLVLEAENRGYKIESGVSALQLDVEGEAISLKIVEKTDRIVHVPTEKDREALRRWEKDHARKLKFNAWVPDWDKPKIPEFDFLFNGQLVIEINKELYQRDGIRRKFADGNSQRLENMIPDILVGVATSAAAIKAERTEKARCERELAERAAKKEIERKRQKLGEKQIESMEEKLKWWLQANHFRSFANAVETQLTATKPENSASVKEWLVWARSYADQIDPLRHPLPVLFKESDFRSWEL